jgi:hypothetical protein
MASSFWHYLKAMNLHIKAIQYQQQGHMKTYIYFSVLRFVCIANCLWHKCSLYHGKPPETVFMSSSIDWWCRNRLPSAHVTVPVRTWLPQWTNLLCWHVSDYLQIVSNILDCIRYIHRFLQEEFRCAWYILKSFYIRLNNKHGYLLVLHIYVISVHNTIEINDTYVNNAL